MIIVESEGCLLFPFPIPPKYFRNVGYGFMTHSLLLKGKLGIILAKSKDKAHISLR